MAAPDSPAPATATDTIAERVAAVRAEMAAACARANRPIDAVTLIAVSKTHPPPPISEAVAAGIRDFGENRVEEADKIAVVNEGAAGIALTWHMIGHVQSRKAGDVLHYYGWIHSLDSVKLAERYARLAAESTVHNGDGRLNVLLEMNVSGELSKEGFAAHGWRDDRGRRESLWNDVRRMVQLPGLRVRGLMTIPPIVASMEAARPTFADLCALRDALAADFPSLEMDTLSMGMTDDYPVAIEEGATVIRVGRAIFGVRA